MAALPGTGDMIRPCRNVGLDEPEFTLTDGFVVTIRRKPDLAFEAVGEITGEVQRPLMIWGLQDGNRPL
jgi:hypothetical protein